MSETKQNRNRKVKSRQLSPREDSPAKERKPDSGKSAAHSSNINRKKNRKRKKVHSRVSDEQRKDGQKTRIAQEQQRDTQAKKPVQEKKAAPSEQPKKKQQKPAAEQNVQKKESQQKQARSGKQRSHKRRFDNIDERKIRPVETAEDISRDIEQIERDIRIDIEGIQTIKLDL